MNENASKKLSAEIEAELRPWLASEVVREAIESTKAAADAGTFEVVITTENLDRYQEVIKLDGWDLEHYRKNPVVLWGHDHSRLIGMATSVDVIDGKMIAKGKFAPTEEGQEKRRLYDLGFLKATSVGFIEKEREGNLITKAELLEFSFVSVPANPYALALAVKSGVSVNEMVTKGIMFVEEAKGLEVNITTNEPQEQQQDQPSDGPTEDPSDQNAGKVDDTPADPQPAERQFDTRAITPIVDALKAAVIALEALGTPEPERSVAAAGDDEETPEEKAYREFSERRRVVQNAATILGEVLAEARKAIKE